MRYQLGGGLTGSAFLDFILAGILIGAAAQALISVLGGKIPGPGMLLAAVAGGVVAVIVFVFKSGIGL